jgi:hypothetical protein
MVQTATYGDPPSSSDFFDRSFKKAFDLTLKSLKAERGLDLPQACVTTDEMRCSAR